MLSLSVTCLVHLLEYDTKVSIYVMEKHITLHVIQELHFPCKIIFTQQHIFGSWSSFAQSILLIPPYFQLVGPLVQLSPLAYGILRFYFCLLILGK